MSALVDLLEVLEGYIHTDVSYGLMGMLIGIYVKRFLKVIQFVVSCKKYLKSLEGKVKSLEPIIKLMGQYNLESPISGIDSNRQVVQDWVEGLMRLHSSARVLAERKIPTFYVFSRYRTSKEIRHLISDIDRYLKWASSFELMLLLWQKTKTEDRAAISAAAVDEPVGDSSPPDESPDLSADIFDIVSGLIGGGIEWAIDSTLHFINNVLRFHEVLSSFDSLLGSIKPIVEEILTSQDKRRRRHPRIGEEISSAGFDHDALDEWIKDIKKILDASIELKNAHKIPKTWNVVSRHKICKRMSELILHIDKHLNSVPVIISAIHLEPLFQKKEFIPDSAPISRSTRTKKLTRTKRLRIMEPQMYSGEEHREGEEDPGEDDGDGRANKNNMEAKDNIPIMRKKSNVKISIEDGRDGGTNNDNMEAKDKMRRKNSNVKIWIDSEDKK